MSFHLFHILACPTPRLLLLALVVQIGVVLFDGGKSGRTHAEHLHKVVLRPLQTNPSVRLITWWQTWRRQLKFRHVNMYAPHTNLGHCLSRIGPCLHQHLDALRVI